MCVCVCVCVCMCVCVCVCVCVCICMCVNDIIKSFMNEYNDIDKEMEGSKVSFKFVGISSTIYYN